MFWRLILATEEVYMPLLWRSGWGIHVNPWLIHVNVWQKPLLYCKVISLQLIKINGKINKGTNAIISHEIQNQCSLNFVTLLDYSTKLFLSPSNCALNLYLLGQELCELHLSVPSIEQTPQIIFSKKKRQHESTSESC